MSPPAVRIKKGIEAIGFDAFFGLFCHAAGGRLPSLRCCRKIAVVSCPPLGKGDVVEADRGIPSRSKNARRE